MADAAQMKELYKRLSVLGFPKSYVTGALPSWWEAEAATTPAGLQHTMLMLSRRLGLDLKTLRGEASGACGPAHCRYKKDARTDNDDLRVATQIALQVGTFVSAATKVPYTPLPAASVARTEILQGNANVGFEALLSYCWAHGVPVVHLAKSAFPTNSRRMHGLTARIRGRPIIVLAKQADYLAWLLFILAHECGHLASGHIGDDAVLVDAVVDKESEDAEEQEANRFALELLCGDDVQFVAKRGVTGPRLAAMARATGRERRIDPGHVALNYAHGADRFGVANAALALIEGKVDVSARVNRRLQTELDWERLTDDDAEFVERMTGCQPPSDRVS